MPPLPHLTHIIKDNWEDSNSGADDIQHPAKPSRQDCLARLTAVLAGVGAIGGSLGPYLFSLGVKRFVLIDPKDHKPANVQTQCEPHEVGLKKVDAAARRLVDLGAEKVVALPAQVEFVEPGCVAANSMIVASCDRMSATRAANELAMQMDVPFFRLQIEPTFDYATLSSHDYRSTEPRCCTVCGWGDKEFLAQENINSCTPTPERPTASPRALSAFAAGWGAMTIVRAMVPELPTDSALWDRMLSFSVMTQKISSDELPRSTDCVCQLQRPEIVRLAETPAQVSFAELVKRGGFHRSLCSIQGSGSLVRRARCDDCNEDQSGLWWSQGDAAVGRCTRCDGLLHAIHFYSLNRFQPHEIGGAFNEPLEVVGAGRQAAVTISESGRQVTYVLA